MTVSILRTAVPFTTACPDWCRLKPEHPADSIETASGRESRIHGGPTFGRFIDVDGKEFADRQGDVALFGGVCDIEPIKFSAAELRQLAADAIAAAEWIEARA